MVAEPSNSQQEAYLNVPRFMALRMLMGLRDSSVPGSQTVPTLSAAFPKCFQRRQPEGEEVVLIKSSLCFPGTGASSRCLLLGVRSQSAQIQKQASLPSDTNLPSWEL